MEAKERMISNPRYQRVAIGIAQRIADGKYQVGEKIKSRSTLASNFNVSPETARKAINVLDDLDIVRVKPGSGVVVTSREKAQEFLEQFETTTVLKSTKNDLNQSISQQKKELEKMSKLLDQFLSQSSLMHKKFPFEPFELVLDQRSPNINKSISELNFWHQTGATIIALKHQEELLLSPGPYATLQSGDTIYFIGDELAFSRVKNFFESP